MHVRLRSLRRRTSPLAALLLGSGLCLAGAAILAPAAGQPDAPSNAPASALPMGTYCLPDGPHLLALRPAEGGAVEIAVSSWQGGMHHCGLSVTAKPVGGGWLYTSGSDRDRQGGCILMIHPLDDAILLGTAAEAPCHWFCGARARLDGLRWPFSSHQGPEADPRLFTDGEFRMNAGC